MVYNDKSGTLEKFSLLKIFLMFRDVILLLKIIIFSRIEIVIYCISNSKIAFLKDFIFLFICKLIFRKYVVCWSHGNHENRIINESPLLNRLYGFIFSRIDSIVINGEKFRNYWLKYFDDKNIITIYNAISEEYIDKNSSKKAKGEKTVILFLAIMIREKGWCDLLEAANILIKKYDNLLFKFCGPWHNDNDINYFNNFVKNNKLDANVEYAGEKHGIEKEQIFLNSDIFVFPTFFKSETFGIVNIEAMKYKLPVISTNIAAIPEINDDGNTGFIIEKNNINQIVEKIEYFIFNPDRIKSMGMNGFERFLKLFTEKTFVNKWLALVNNIGMR